VNRIFYTIPTNIRYELLQYARPLSKEINLEELDCKKSWSRINTDKTFDEIVEIAKETTDDRNVFFMENNQSWLFINNQIRVCTFLQDILEIGVSTYTINPHNHITTQYFIFMKLDKKYLNEFIDKFKLTKAY